MIIRIIISRRPAKKSLLNVLKNLFVKRKYTIAHYRTSGKLAMF